MTFRPHAEAMKDDENVDNEMVVAPGKALRLADMIDVLVKEIHEAPIDEEARIRFLGLYHATLVEVGSTLSDALLEEFARLQTANMGESRVM